MASSALGQKQASMSGCSWATHSAGRKDAHRAEPPERVSAMNNKQVKLV